MATETQTYETEINLFVHTPEGYDAHVKVVGVPHNLLVGTLASVSQRMEQANMTASQRFGGSSNGNGHKPAPAASQSGPVPFDDESATRQPPICTNCAGPVWDNRTNKRNPKGPDFKCKDTACGYAAWIDKKNGGLTWKGPAL